jgi:hypothetical protein
VQSEERLDVGGRVGRNGRRGGNGAEAEEALGEHGVNVATVWGKAES